MSDEKPLHVRVAEALGTELQFVAGGWMVPLRSFHHAGVSVGNEFGPCPRYDTDWSATGPLIEKHKITIEAILDGGVFVGFWCAWVGQHRDPYAEAKTPLLAACNLFLLLSEKGLLREAI